MSTTAAPRAPTIDGDTTVNQAIAAYPGSIRILNALGVDACCGGAQRLAVVARQLDLPVQALVDAITDALP